MATPSGQRTVLARRVDGFVPYKWTDARPADLHEVEVALALGARWEGDELVTYELEALTAQLEFWDDDWTTDND